MCSDQQVRSPPYWAKVILKLSFTSTPTRWASFAEIHGRYHLVAGTDHHMPLQKFSEDFDFHYHQWCEKNHVVDLEDARSILHAFTERVTKNTITHPLPDVPIVGNMLAYVSPRRGLTPGVEDLMLPALRVAVEHFWLALAGKTLTVGFRTEAEDPASRALTAQ